MIKKRLNQLKEEAGVGFWAWDVNANELIWDRGMYCLFGITKETATGTYKDFAQYIQKEDRLRIESNLKECIENKKPFSDVLELNFPGGEVNYLRAYGNMITDTLMAGVNFKITRGDYNEFYKNINVDIATLKNHRAASALFSIRKLVSRAVPFDINEYNTDSGWIDFPSVILSNGIFRILSKDSNYSVLDCVTINGKTSSIFHNFTKIITNLSNVEIEVWITGESHILTEGESVKIKDGDVHRIVCDGNCHFIMTLLNHTSSTLGIKYESFDDLFSFSK